MAPFSTKPRDSRAVRWQQRSITAQGAPASSSHRTMSSPSSRNGFGPLARCAIGMTGYQKRRSTGCLVTCMVGLSVQRSDSVSARDFGIDALSLAVM